jgi:hypothetical protein
MLSSVTDGMGSETQGGTVMSGLSSGYMTQPAHIGRAALRASSLRAAQSWWACR